MFNSKIKNGSKNKKSLTNLFNLIKKLVKKANNEEIMMPKRANSE